MADYSSVLARAVQGKKTADDRCAVYDRARSALVNQLRSIDPPLPESDITRQRMALEDAIARVEADIEARASATTPVAPPQPAPAPLVAPDEPPPVAPPPLAAPPAPPPTPPSRDPDPEPRRVEAALGPASGLSAPRPAGEPELTANRTLPALEPERPARSRRGLVFVLVAAIIVAAVAATVWAIRGGFFEAGVANGPAQTASGSGSTAPKSEERLPAGGGTAAAPSGAAPSAPAQAAVVAQAALLYEENADASRGADTFRGTVTWRLDTEQAQTGQERIIRALVDISDRGLRLLLVVRRNPDPALPASHTVEILFDVAPNFVHGAVESLGGLRMKPSEQAQGLPLVGATARITAGYFLIGLSAISADREQNVVLLRDRPWLDLPIVYRNGRRAVLAIEKGVPGERVFQEAFQAWGN